MVAALIDTAIVVDLLRGYEAAQTWFNDQRDLGVSRAVWFEIIEGTEDRAALRQALKLLQRFELVKLTTDDLIWATSKLLQFNLSHNIDSFDCMIAAVSYRLNLPLYTRNLKHFTLLLKDRAISPY